MPLKITISANQALNAKDFCNGIIDYQNIMIPKIPTPDVDTN